MKDTLNSLTQKIRDIEQIRNACINKEVQLEKNLNGTPENESNYVAVRLQREKLDEILRYIKLYESLHYSHFVFMKFLLSTTYIGFLNTKLPDWCPTDRRESLECYLEKLDSFLKKEIINSPTWKAHFIHAMLGFIWVGLLVAFSFAYLTLLGPNPGLWGFLAFFCVVFTMAHAVNEMRPAWQFGIEIGEFDHRDPGDNYLAQINGSIIIKKYATIHAHFFDKKNKAPSLCDEIEATNSLKSNELSVTVYSPLCM